MSTHVGNLIRKKRLERGLTQVQAAKLIDLGGPMFISQVEGGISKLPLDRVKVFCEALKMDKLDVYKALVEDYKVSVKQALNWGDL